MTTVESYERLPKWAQTEMRRLRSDLEAAELRLRSAFGEQATAVEVEPYRVQTGDGRLFLPDRTTVRFNLSGGYIDVGIRRNCVEVMAHGKEGDLVVWPGASNVVHCGFSYRS